MLFGENYYYSGFWLSEIQEPHPQPPPRKRGGDYDVFHLSAYRYKAVIATNLKSL